MENEGALYRGFALGHPQEVWAPSTGWMPYQFASEFKPIEWGGLISEDEALAIMGERTKGKD